MHSLLRHSGFPVVSYRSDGLTLVCLDVSQPPAPAYAHEQIHVSDGEEPPRLEIAAAKAGLV
jgi:hypothetical protein